MASYQTIPGQASAPRRVELEGHQRTPDMITAYGGNVFGFADVIVRKLGRLLEEVTDDDCTILLCGFFCQPCLIAQALEEVGENWWLTCCTVTFAPNCFGFPYLCWTVPAMDRLNVRLGGQPMYFRNLICLCLCRPCVACQLARAVKGARQDGMLTGGANTPAEAIRLGPTAPMTESMERL